MQARGSSDYRMPRLQRTRTILAGYPDYRNWLPRPFSAAVTVEHNFNNNPGDYGYIGYQEPPMMQFRYVPPIRSFAPSKFLKQVPTAQFRALEATSQVQGHLETTARLCPFNNRNFLKSLLPMELHHLKEIENHVTVASSCHHPSLKDVVFIGGSTPLIVACQFGELFSVKHLIDNWKVSVNASAPYFSDPANLNRSKIRNASPLFVAAFLGHSCIARFLLERGADPSVKLSAEDCDLLGEFDGWTPLHAALSGVKIDSQRPLLEQQEERNAVVRILLEFGADPKADFFCSSQGKPMWAESMCGYDTITTLIKNHDLDLEQRIPQTGQTLLHHIIGRLNEEDSLMSLVILLVEKGIDLMARDKEGFTPLLTAAKYSKLAVLDYLLEKGGYSRTEEIEALELAGATAILGALDESLFPKAFDHWRRAHRLHEMEKEASGPSAEKKLGRKIGSNVEWTTLAQLDQLEQNPEEYKIQAFLVYLRILSGFDGDGHHDLSSFFINYLCKLEPQRTAYSYDQVLEWTKWQYSLMVEIQWGMFDVVINRLDPLSTDQDVLFRIFEHVDQLVFCLSQITGFYPTSDPFDYYKILKTSMDLFLLATRPSIPVTNIFPCEISPDILLIKGISRFLEMIFGLPEWPDEHNTANSLTQMLRQLEPYLGPNRLGKLLLSACPSYISYIQHYPNLKFINLALIRVLLKAGADPNATDEKRCDDNTLLHFVAAMSDRELGDAAGRLLVGYGAKFDLPNRAGKTALDIWIETNETKENWNEELGGWIARPEWCCPLPTLLNLAARVIRVRKIPYLSAPVILHPVVELRD